jgi:uncharacterized protein
MTNTVTPEAALIPQSLSPAQQQQLEAAAFRRLLAHLQQHTELQNIDLMNLAGFCRNCLAKWYQAEAEQLAIPLSQAECRMHIYGMPYEEWKALYQQ